MIPVNFSQEIILPLIYNTYLKVFGLFSILNNLDSTKVIIGMNFIRSLQGGISIIGDRISLCKEWWKESIIF